MPDVALSGFHSYFFWGISTLWASPCKDREIENHNQSLVREIIPAHGFQVLGGLR